MKMLTDKEKNFKKNLTKTLVTNDMLSAFENKDLTSLIELWHDRSQDRFYRLLKKLKDLTNSYYEKTNETNPFLFVMFAYCIDGNKEKSVEKSRQFITLIPAKDALDDTTADKVVNTFVDLELLCDDYKTIDKTVFNVNSGITISDYYDLVLDGFDPDYGLTGNNFKVSITDDDKVKICFNAIADKEDLDWITENLFTGEKFDLKVSLRDKETDKWYGLAIFSECDSFEYINNIEKNNTVDIIFKIGNWYMIADTDDPSFKILEDIKDNIETNLIRI